MPSWLRGWHPNTSTPAANWVNLVARHLLQVITVKDHKDNKVDYLFSMSAGWVRFGNHLISYTFSQPLFSERHGYRIPIVRITIGSKTFAILYTRKANGT